MISVGVDYSLTSPAVCILGEEEPPRFLFFSSKKKHAIMDPDFLCAKPPPKHAESLDFTRYRFIASTVVTFIASSISPGSEFGVFVEGYSYGSKGRVFEIGENQATLINALYEKWRAWPTRFAPTEIKKFATGKGNANKELMVKAFVEATKIDIHTLLGETKVDAAPISDIADAYWIARMGQEQ